MKNLPSGKRMNCTKKKNSSVSFEAFNFYSTWQLEAVQLDTQETTILSEFNITSAVEMSKMADFGSKAYKFCLRKSQTLEPGLPTLKMTMKVSPDHFVSQVLTNVQSTLDYVHT